jgi:hypothetical protein
VGYSLSWIAVKQSSPEQIHSALGVRPTGKREDFPESPITGAELPNGSYLVVFDREELNDRTLAKYSSSCELIHCFVEEHVMYSTVAAWKGGICVWSATHDAQEGILYLHLEGPVPPSATAIRERLMKEQQKNGGANSDVDYIFDIPVELAKELTGFRHDEEIEGLAGAAFEVLEPVGKTGSFKIPWNPLKLFSRKGR